MAVISCPRRCSRLIAAAILLSAGIVQLIAGLVLLRSDYVSLLSAPDFWTAISNIGVGCLIGLLASVWKHDRRSRTINRARRHMVRALYITSLLVNVTTSVILILGEGNALLSVQEVEKSEDSPELLLASEILAYAYAASVISPITCSMVSFVCLLFSCCPEPSSSKRLTKKRFRKKLGKAETYGWVYTPEIDRSVKSLERKSLFRGSCGGYSNRSSMTFSSSFSGFASGLESPVPKMYGNSNHSKIGSIRDINGGKQSITPSPPPTSPIDTDVSFEENGSTPPVGQIVPIHLGMRSSNRQPSAIPVKVPIAPERDWSNRSWTASPSVPVDNGYPSTKPKTKMNFGSSCDSSGEEDTSPKSSRNKGSAADDYYKSKRMLRKEHKKINSNHLKRPDLMRLKLMESINECPIDYSDDDSLCRNSPTTSSGYGSTFEPAMNSTSPYGQREATSMDEMHCGKSRPTSVDLNDERTIQDRLNAFREV